jgi:hypothetical protein
VWNSVFNIEGERSQDVFEYWVSRRIFGPKRDEVTGEWRQLHNEELDCRYCSSNVIRVIKSRRMRRAGYVARMSGGVYSVLVGERERKKPPGITWRRLEYNIKLDLQEVGWRGLDWIDLAQDRDRCRVRVNAVMNLRVP